MKIDENLQKYPFNSFYKLIHSVYSVLSSCPIELMSATAYSGVLLVKQARPKKLREESVRQLSSILQRDF